VFGAELCLCQDHVVSFGTVFPQDCVTGTKAGAHQKLQQQETSQSTLNKHKAQAAIQTQPYSYHPSKLFSFAGTVPCCGEKLQQAYDFSAHS